MPQHYNMGAEAGPGGANQAPGQIAPTSPQNPGQQQLTPELMQLLMVLLTSMPESPPGDVADHQPPHAPPPMAQQPTETEEQMRMMMGLLQQGQPARMGLNGMQGAPFGGMGGRPPGS